MFNLKFNPCLMISAVFAIVMCFANYTFAEIVMDFNNPPVDFQDGYGPGMIYSEDGFIINTENEIGHRGSFIRVNPFRQNCLVPNNGSVHVAVTFYANPWLQRADDGLFSLFGLDIGEYSEFCTGQKMLRLTGTQADGTVLVEELAIDGIFDGLGGVEDFQHYDLDWTNLVRVDFETQGVSFDNINLAAVPEPSAILLFIGGTLTFLFRKYQVSQN